MIPAIISPQWLHDHMHNAGIKPEIRIVDATYFPPNMTGNAAENWAKSHIDGAVFLDIDQVADHNSALPHMVPDADAFAAAIGMMGISNDHHVICYDQHGVMTAPRAWWMFRYFGHDRVSVLDGGLPAWIAAGLPVSTAFTHPAPAHFTATPQPQRLIDRQTILKQIEQKTLRLIDARAADRFAGTAPEIWPGRRAGHIPGACNLPFGQLIDPTTRQFRPDDSIKAAFSGLGIDLSPGVAVSCGSGVTACVLALALAKIGIDPVRVYDGSWAEWGLYDAP